VTTAVTTAADAARQLHVLREDGHTLGVYGAKIGILKETNDEALDRLLERTNG
jgi:hypothetical protein